jgi:uncharacterized sulfatase
MVDERIVSFVDFGPTVLSLADIEPPAHMQGRPFLGKHEREARMLAFSYRDRMDERFDLIRSVWDGRWHYIRNYFPHLPWFHHQTRNYPHTQDSYVMWHRLAAEGRLAGDTAVYMADRRPAEMLFDTQADPHEVRNLSEEPAYQGQLDKLRAALRRWQDDVVDLGFMPESVWIEQLQEQGRPIPRHTLVREQRDLYPLRRLRSLADLLPQRDQAAAMLDALRSENTATKFWGGMGLLANRTDTQAVRAEFRNLLNDPSPTLRTLAAQGLAAIGEPEPALTVLLEVLNHDQPLVALRAANALDHLGETARPALPGMRRYLETRKDVDPKSQPLGTSFVQWTLQRSVAQLEPVEE